MKRGKKLTALALALFVATTSFYLPATAKAETRSNDQTPVAEHTYNLTFPSEREGYEILEVDTLAQTKTSLAKEVNTKAVLRYDDYSFAIDLGEDYEKTSDVRVYADQKEYKPDADGVYTISNISADMTVEVLGVSNTQTVTHRIAYGTTEHVTISQVDADNKVVDSNATSMLEGEYLRFQVSIDQGYMKAENFAVKDVDGNILQPDADGIYTLQVMKDQQVEVSGIQEGLYKVSFKNYDSDYFKVMINGEELTEEKTFEIAHGDSISYKIEALSDEITIKGASSEVLNLLVFANKENICTKQISKVGDSYSLELKPTTDTQVEISKDFHTISIGNYNGYRIAWELVDLGNGGMCGNEGVYQFAIQLKEGYKNNPVVVASRLDCSLVSSDKENGYYLYETKLSYSPADRTVSGTDHKIYVGAGYVNGAAGTNVNLEFSPDTYKLKYFLEPENSETNTCYTTREATHGYAAEAPEDPTSTKDGYGFAGWYTSTGKKYDFDKKVTDNINLYAHWSKLYKVTYKDGNKILKTDQVVEGGNATKPKMEKEGYEFDGWFTEDGDPYDFTSKITGDLTLEASWTKCHKVTFDTCNQVEALEDYVLPGNTVSEPYDPKMNGFTFLGWYTKSGSLYDFSSKVKGDLTLYAKWKQKSGFGISGLKGQYTYTGKALQPAVKVTYAGKTLKAGTDYTITYSNNKKVGKATVKIKGKGLYTDSKTLSFNIVPKSTKITKAKALKGKKNSLTWKKISGAAGYRIYRSTKKNSGFKKLVDVSAKKGSYTDKVKSKKTYYYKIQVIAKGSNGKYYGSSYSAAKKIVTKK